MLKTKAAFKAHVTGNNGLKYMRRGRNTVKAIIISGKG